MASVDVAFGRAHLALVLEDVRRHYPGIQVNLAWVYHFGRDHWEFHGPDNFYWHGRAGGAYDARAKGWAAYLRHMGKEE